MTYLNDVENDADGCTEFLHYNLKVNQERIKLTKSKNPKIFKKLLPVNTQHIKIFNPGFSVYWKVLNK